MVLTIIYILPKNGFLGSNYKAYHDHSFLESKDDIERS